MYDYGNAQYFIPSKDSIGGCTKPHKCHICGKEFECGPEYVYKRRQKRKSAVLFFCSWTCLRKYDRMLENAEHKAKV